MDIQKFVQRRKRRGISQVALCDGICTQSTLSKFESNGQIPSVLILGKLCQRLDLSIDDLAEDGKCTQKPVHKTVLDEAELNLMAEKFPLVISQLRSVKEQKLPNRQQRMQYYYLRGMLDTLTNNQTATTMFNFTQILDKLDEQHETVYSQLAYLGSGILYARKNELGNAEFFFTKVINYLRAQNDSVKLAKETPTTYLRLIMMLYYVAEYEALRERYPRSNHCLKMVTDFCARRHVTFFMPRTRLLQANNAIRGGGDPAHIADLLNDALVFARFNHNNVVELQTAALKKHFA
ncbi:helix-turn-helix transcriptional regulator [Limosilactobacillus panis]|uniref:helix-turn-helix domain-containing protein n=1 Tax=Limosilactobacillus panis TaxID=47493 RepID=UPI001C97C821|nr:helix-turn-helix transcriptional regulator [Limosilactobacillus panis]QZN93331.1 helix-turn-helix transcriptional regulator [Limosilactobacillus panis]